MHEPIQSDESILPGSACRVKYEAIELIGFDEEGRQCYYLYREPRTGAMLIEPTLLVPQQVGAVLT